MRVRRLDCREVMFSRGKIGTSMIHMKLMFTTYDYFVLYLMMSYDVWVMLTCVMWSYWRYLCKLMDLGLSGCVKALKDSGRAEGGELDRP